MSDPVIRLNAALEGRYSIERHILGGETVGGVEQKGGRVKRVTSGSIARAAWTRCLILSCVCLACDGTNPVDLDDREEVLRRLANPYRSSPELCVKVRGSSSMLRLGCLGDLLRFEKREIEVAAFAPDRSSPQSNRGDEAERTGSVGEGAGAPDPTLDLGVQALEAVRGA